LNNLTLAILKPDSFENGVMGKIIAKIEEAGFNIQAMRMMHLNKKVAGEFYAVHKGKPFYDDLISYMTSGPAVPMVLEKENAVEEFRKLIGATDPSEADDGTIRKLFAESKSRNSVHGSDSNENATLEITFFFSKRELSERPCTIYCKP